MKRLLASASVAVFIGGCVATYRDVEASKPFATIEFSKGYGDVPMGQGAAQSYMIWEEPTLKRAALYNFFGDSQAERRVAVDRPVKIVAMTIFNRLTSLTAVGGSVVPGAMKSSRCDETAEFLPEAGHAYVVLHSTRTLWGDDCKLHVTDKATGLPPSGLKTAIVVPPNDWSAFKPFAEPAALPPK